MVAHTQELELMIIIHYFETINESVCHMTEKLSVELINLKFLNIFTCPHEDPKNFFLLIKAK